MLSGLKRGICLRFKMKIIRQWAMPNKRTFTIKPIAELIKKYKKKDGLVLDPFPFEYKVDATKFLKSCNDNIFTLGLFDPPYSPRQLKECYKGKGEYDTKASTWSNWKKLIANKIVTGGICISFGWNTCGLGKKRGFEIIEILIVCHGGMHNDTICVVERRVRD